MVAETFLENLGELPCINHKDGDKQNNHISNLEWCGVSHNTKEAYRLGFLSQRGEKNNACKYSDELVKKIREEYPGGSIMKYAKTLGMNYGTVRSYIKQTRRVE